MELKRELSNVLRLLLAGVFFVVGSASIQAQDVTVSPKTGAMIPAVHDESLSSDTEVGWYGGGFAMWRHNQLPLSVAVSYNADLNEDGLLKYHNNLMYLIKQEMRRQMTTQAATATSCFYQDITLVMALAMT